MDAYLLANHHKVINNSSNGSDEKKLGFKDLLACCPTNY
jgi:hypothetical protein